ncbi:MAG TPA: hypothetical protein VGX78_03210 [Pirellulales bacterium]|jgi:hypothetical protein|nr:hypothetical protein [Pirellulales bacterium]
MDENPYKSPKSAETRGTQSRPFLRWPTTAIEWVVIVFVVLLIVVMLLPNIDEDRGASRQRMGTNEPDPSLPLPQD